MLRECHRVGLTVQLAAYGKVGRFIQRSLWCNLQFRPHSLEDAVHVQCGYLEHLAGALTVTSGDQWCVHVHEIPLLEKFMDCISAAGNAHGILPQKC